MTERAARLDHNVIVRLIPEKSKVLDLGCGDGALLEKLMGKRKINGRGIEISEIGVKQCISKGLTVFQGDLDEGLRDIPDSSFDFVILNQTLQAVKKPDLVLSEMLRVGRKGIVGFPNFGYWKVRSYLLLRGEMPKTRSLPFEWYNTPNIHFFTIKDFFSFCRGNGIQIEKKVYFSTEGGGRILGGAMPNLFAEHAILVVSH